MQIERRFKLRKITGGLTRVFVHTPGKQSVLLSPHDGEQVRPLVASLDVHGGPCSIWYCVNIVRTIHHNLDFISLQLIAGCLAKERPQLALDVNTKSIT